MVTNIFAAVDGLDEKAPSGVVFNLKGDKFFVADPKKREVHSVVQELLERRKSLPVCLTIQSFLYTPDLSRRREN